jgi:hypothetical protein
VAHSVQRFARKHPRKNRKEKIMAKTAAEQQAAYRKKRPYAGAEGNGERNFNMWVHTAADDGILATLNAGEPAFDSYLGKAVTH